MKKFAKTLVALSLALTFFVSGAFSTPCTPDLNEGIMLLHDGPSKDVAKY